jgi:hypothetical protein
VCDGEGFFQIVRDLAHLYRALRRREDEQTGVAVKGDEGEVEPSLSPPHNVSYMAGLADSMKPEERVEALAHRPEHYVVHNADKDGPANEVAAAAASASPSAPAAVAVAAVVDGPLQSRVLRFSVRELHPAVQAHVVAALVHDDGASAVHAHLTQQHDHFPLLRMRLLVVAQGTAVLQALGARVGARRTVVRGIFDLALRGAVGDGAAGRTAAMRDLATHAAAHFEDSRSSEAHFALRE